MEIAGMYIRLFSTMRFVAHTSKQVPNFGFTILIT